MCELRRLPARIKRTNRNIGPQLRIPVLVVLVEVVQIESTDIVTDQGCALIAPMAIKGTDGVSMGAGIALIQAFSRQFLTRKGLEIRYVTEGIPLLYQAFDLSGDVCHELKPNKGGRADFPTLPPVSSLF